MVREGLTEEAEFELRSEVGKGVLSEYFGGEHFRQREQHVQRA